MKSQVTRSYFFGNLYLAAASIVLGIFLLPQLNGVAGSVTSATTQASQQPVNASGPAEPRLKFSANPVPEEFFRAHIFDEPLVPVGGEPSAVENAALAQALNGYADRTGPDDFSSLTGFLQSHPNSPWATALLTDLGLEYYNTAHYSLALDAWERAWALGRDATEPRAKALADRAFGELITMNARLGRMTAMRALLKSIEQRPVTGPVTERITGAREALWGMENTPQVCFRCGPLALRSILLAQRLNDSRDSEIMKSASTQKGCSLTQVADLSRKVGLNYQMAYRTAGAEFIAPAVVHWKVGHYAALLRKEGDLYELNDPTFGNKTWATREALESETTGYFLVPPGSLPVGWRGVEAEEGAAIWGKGQTTFNDNRQITKRDLKTSDMVCRGMPVPSIHLMLANLNLSDEPLGYSPPVGPSVRLIMRYNQRDSFQPANFNYSNFGYKWTCDWISYITDNPSNLVADVNLYVDGGGVRTFTGFDPISQTFEPQQYDQTQLKRTGPASYELLARDGSKMVYSQSDGSIGTTRHVFLTQVIDPQGNAFTLSYDANIRIVTVTDAIGQVTALSYGLAGDIYKITQVTDPFGRSATFGYEQIGTGPTPFIRLTSITDVIGLTSRFVYNDIVNGTQLTFTSFVETLVTPYGTNIFTSDDMGLGQAGNDRFLEINYPDGSRERVEYTQTNALQAISDPPASVPAGVELLNDLLRFRNSYYWSRTACATSYRDYSKARIYHWLHSENLSTTSGALESAKLPLEGRVWYDYPGETTASLIGASTLPRHVGRVLDDGSTQLYTYEYNPLGHVTNSIDPLGRTLTYFYDTNGIDLLEVRQTRSGNELLLKATYNSLHRPVTVTDAAGQTTRYSYNSRGQMLSTTNARNETVSFDYDGNGYLLAIHGSLPGTNDSVTITRDAFGRCRTVTDVSGYTLTFSYDNLDRVTNITYPDATFDQVSYDRLDPAVYRDRAGRQTFLTYDSLRQLEQITDPLGRVTRVEWCRCGALKSLTDPLGRTTSWLTDVQGRPTAKQYADGSQVTYAYEVASSRLRQVTDEKQQITTYNYNLDNSFHAIHYANTFVSTPSVEFTYDPNYERVTSVTDGAGITLYAYNPITSNPVLGAGLLESVTGPLTNESASYGYDELKRPVHRVLNGVDSMITYDVDGRAIGGSNALGSFQYTYDGASFRLLSASMANGLTVTRGYGGVSQDLIVQGITNRVAAGLLSEFLYGRDIPKARITSWTQQAGAQPPSVYSFAYDAANQLLSATVTNSGALVNTFSYSYDLAANRLSDQAGASAFTTTFNALNQLSTTTTPAGSRTNEWDGANRLTAITVGNQRSEFAYDGSSRLVGIRKLVNGIEVSHRMFAWSGGQIAEERDTGGNINKRFFARGVQLVTGTNAGLYYYTRDHLGSIREITDTNGSVRARYTYDPYGHRTKVSGDMDADFGFAGMFWAAEANIGITRFRAYDPDLGRWFSRDRLKNAELTQGPNLYAYVGNNPVNQIDPEGLCTGSSLCACLQSPQAAAACAEAGIIQSAPYAPPAIKLVQEAANHADELVEASEVGVNALESCPDAPAAIQQMATLQQLSNPMGLQTGIEQAQWLGQTLSADPALLNTIATEDTAIAENISSQNLPWALEWANSASQFRAWLGNVSWESQQMLFSLKLAEVQQFLERLNNSNK